MKKFLFLLFLAFIHHSVIALMLFPFATHGYNETHSHTSGSSWAHAAFEMAYFQLQWPLFRPITLITRGTSFELITHGRHAIQFFRFLGVTNSLAWIMGAYLLVTVAKRSKKPDQAL